MIVLTVLREDNGSGRSRTYSSKRNWIYSPASQPVAHHSHEKKEKSTEIICFNETLLTSYELMPYPHPFPDVCFMLGYLGEPLLTIKPTRLLFI